jgi:transcriptional regulator with XRE-family HTH domain
MTALDKFPTLGKIKGMDLPSFLDLDQRARLAGLSTRDIARRLGIGLSTYYRWIGGETEPLHSQVITLSQVVEAAEQRAAE